MGGRRARTIDAIERDAQAVEFRRRAFTYRQIAGEMGWASPKSAYEAVQRGLRDAIQEPADEVRRMELDRLDEYQRHALRVLARKHLLVDHGVVVLDPAGPVDAPKPLEDDGPVLAALDRLLKISERRARLLGLDAPSRTRVEVITDDEVSAAIRELETQIGEFDRARAQSRSVT